MIRIIALAGVAQWTEGWPVRTKGSLVRFPVRVHAWAAGKVPPVGASERQPHIDVSLLFFLPPFPAIC